MDVNKIAKDNTKVKGPRQAPTLRAHTAPRETLAMRPTTQETALYREAAKGAFLSPLSLAQATAIKPTLSFSSHHL